MCWTSMPVARRRRSAAQCEAEPIPAEAKFNAPGLAFPAKTPRAIVDRLNAETQKALAVPAVKERLATFGVEPMPMTVDEFGKFYRDDVVAIVKLAKDVNLVPTN